MRATQGSSLALGVFSLLSAAKAGAVVKRDPAPLAALPGAWTYKGCWTDIGRTIDAAAKVDNVAMTVEACIAFCVTKGFQYAGVEYYQECYCGETLAPTSHAALEADCSYPCTGNASEACGGGSRLSLYYSTSPVGPQPNPGPGDWSYIGCYR